MNLRIDDEDRYWRTHDQEEDRGWWRFASPLKYVLVLLGAIVLIVGIWYIFGGKEHSQSEKIPLIRADQTPYKLPSEDKSVSSVQNQDKLVYERLQGTSSEAHVEHILPQPESVADITPPPQMMAAGDDVVKMVPQYPDAEAIPPAMAQQLEDFPEETGMMVEEDPGQVVPDEDPISALITQASAEEKVEVKKEDKITGGVQIQLGSLKSHKDAESEWKRLSKKYANVLGKLKSSIQQVDLGAEKGIFHRLRAGHFKTREEAKAACRKLSSEGVSCLVVTAS